MTNTLRNLFTKKPQPTLQKEEAPIEFLSWTGLDDINDKINTEEELTYKEIAKLGKEAYLSYVCWPYTPACKKREYAVDNVQASLALLKLLNLGDEVNADIAGYRPPYGMTLKAHLEESIELIKNGDPLTHFSEVSNCLYHICVCDMNYLTHIDIQKLNEALKPYFFSLLVVGKLGKMRWRKSH